MTAYEITIVVGGMILGYYLVTIFITGNSDTSTRDSATTDSALPPVRSVPEEHDPENWHLILEIAENSTREQISDAYKSKIHQYHPDKVAHMGIELRELALLRTQQINAAYNYAMKIRH